MKALKLALLTLICLLFTAASKQTKAPESSLSTIVSKLQNEVAAIALEERTLIRIDRDLLLGINTLMEDMDRVIRKIDEGEITYWNDEIADINRRIWDFHYKNVETSRRRKSLSHRILIVECKLNTNPKLKERVPINSIYKAVGEWDTYMDKNDQQIELYNNRVDAFKSRVDKLPKK